MFVEAVVFLSAIIGCLLALSAFVFHMITRQNQLGSENPEKLFDAVVDEALEEINRTSQLVLDELNEKYKALLFMYQLMDDKQKAIDEVGHTVIIENPMAIASQVNPTAEMVAENPEIKAERDSAINPEIKAERNSVVNHEVKAEHDSAVNPEAKSEQDSTVDYDFAEWLNTKQTDNLLDDKEIQDLMTDESSTRENENVKQNKRPVHPRFDEINELKSQGLSVAEIAKRLGMGQGEISLIIGLSGR